MSQKILDVQSQFDSIIGQKKYIKSNVRAQNNLSLKAFTFSSVSASNFTSFISQGYTLGSNTNKGSWMMSKEYVEVSNAGFTSVYFGTYLSSTTGTLIKIGCFDGVSGFGIGYKDSTFGVFEQVSGVQETYSLVYGAGGVAGTYGLTINGVANNAVLTAGTVAEAAIASSLFTDTVCFRPMYIPTGLTLINETELTTTVSDIVASAGTTTLTTSVTQSVAGVAPTTTWYTSLIFNPINRADITSDFVIVIGPDCRVIYFAAWSKTAKKYLVFYIHKTTTNLGSRFPFKAMIQSTSGASSTIRMLGYSIYDSPVFSGINGSLKNVMGQYGSTYYGIPRPNKWFNFNSFASYQTIMTITSSGHRVIGILSTSSATRNSYRLIGISVTPAGTIFSSVLVYNVLQTGLYKISNANTVIPGTTNLVIAAGNANNTTSYTTTGTSICVPIKGNDPSFLYGDNTWPRITTNNSLMLSLETYTYTASTSITVNLVFIEEI